MQQYNRKIRQIRRVAPDGNCLFRALSHQAFGDQMYHTQMRAALVTQISNNLEKYQPFILEEIHFISMLVLCLRTASGVRNWKYKQLLIASYELMYNSATNG